MDCGFHDKRNVQFWDIRRTGCAAQDVGKNVSCSDHLPGLSRFRVFVLMCHHVRQQQHQRSLEWGRFSMRLSGAGVCSWSDLEQIINTHSRKFVQAFYVVFGFSSSMWMNALVSSELHSIIVSSTSMARLNDFKKPSLRRILTKVSVVYAISLFIASWMQVDFIPLRASPAAGMACLPMQYNVESEVFFWLVFINLILLMPLGVVLFVIWDIYRKGCFKNYQGAAEKMDLLRKTGVFFMKVRML